LQIGQDGDMKGIFSIDQAYVFDNAKVLFVGAMAKVQAKDVDTGIHKLQQLIMGVGGWAYRGDDLGFMVHDERWYDLVNFSCR
jgi:hypothetical protein